jgi:carboxyvinyl-carboxyphosphonate phosphorylmutase
MTRHTEQRKKARALLAGRKCLSPASIYDPLSARIAEQVGFEIGLLSGSVSSLTTLAAPDIVVLTLTEFSDQIRRIMRVSNLSLLVDADHGYGNALNVMRTVAELEHAGVSVLGIEDMVLPARFGRSGNINELVSIEEMTGKLRAALAARQDPALVIAARIAAARVEGVEGTVARAKAYAKTGVDALFVVEVDDIAIIRAVHGAVDLPLIVGSGPMSAMRDELTALGTRILLQGHQPVAAAAKALHDAYVHLFCGGAPAELKPIIATSADLERLIFADEYKKAQREYLR